MALVKGTVKTLNEIFPIKITKRNGTLTATVKIHQAEQVQSGHKYVGFLAVYSLGGKRKRLWRSDLSEAKKLAEEKCDEILNGGHAGITLRETDKIVWQRSREMLSPLGVELDVAVCDYVAAAKDLPTGTTLREAVDFFRRRNGSVFEKRTVRQVVDEMLGAKREAGWSDVHLKDLECRLGRFADAMQMNIAEVSGKLIQTWLNSMKRSGRTKQNYRRCVSSLFHFAIKQKYLPKDAIDEVKSVERPKEDVSEVQIFTPSEMRDILAVARPEMVPWLAIAGFAGLRSAEIARLSWKDVNLSNREIHVTAAKAKTRSHRIVPISENLVEWLTPLAKEDGNVVKFKSWWNQVAEITDAVNARRGPTNHFVWRHNGLRHTYCTMRMAELKDAQQVSVEAGNSPAMIFQHYRNGKVSESLAREWFDIYPTSEANAQKLAA